MYGCCLMLLKMLIRVTTKVRLGSYIAQKAEKRYNWEFILFKIQKEDLAGYLFYWKDQNKERVESFLTKKIKMRYSFVSNCAGAVK